MADTRSDTGSGATDAGNKPRAKAPSPWSVRGVSREARAKASKAASRRRETIGEWVTNALTQIANEELGTGPRRDYGQGAQADLPATSVQDESALGKALLALAERSRALTLLVERLESSEKRENSLLTMMQSVAERAERGEERIATITRGLADLALNMETVLTKNNSRTAQNITNSVAPLEDAVNALGSRLSSAAARAAPEAPATTNAAQFYGTPARSSPDSGAHSYGDAAHAESAAPGGDTADGALESGGETGGRLKFNFDALNARAIENSQKLAHDLDYEEDQD